VVVGARFSDHGGATDAGAAYVFERDQGGPGAWGQVAKLAVETPDTDDYFGQAVAVSGDAVAVGAPGADVVAGSADRKGAVFVFERDLGGPGAWGALARLTASDGASNDQFGAALAVGASTLVVGASGDDDGGSASGSAYVFERDASGSWGETLKLVASDAEVNDQLGAAVGLWGRVALCGAHWHDLGDAFDAGQAYVFALPTSVASYCTAGVSAGGCRAHLAAEGIASATAPSGFTVTAAGADGARSGLLLFGAAGRQATPWTGGAGFECVVPPLVGGASLASSGAPGTCDGVVAEDLNARWCPTCPGADTNPGAGAVVQAQLWLLAPAGAGGDAAASLSDGIEFQVGP